MKSQPSNNYLAYMACLLLTLAMGGLHAYGALLESVEVSLAVDRVAASLVYGASLVGATVGVLLVPRLLASLRPILIALILLGLSLLAVVLVYSGTLSGWLLGYGLFYGLASGGGYALCLSLSSACLGTGREGLAMGGVTAAFAAGSAWFAWSNSQLLDWLSVADVFAWVIAQVVLLVALAILLWWRSPILLTFTFAKRGQLKHSGIWSLWLIYGLGVFAGLMTLGHALPILKAAQVAPDMAVNTLALMAIANGVACVLAGNLGDRFGFLKVLQLVLCASVASALLMSFANGLLAVIMMLSISALYGAFIALYPAFVQQLYGQQSAPQIYGRVFTAWGLAGLTAAPIAAWLLHVYGSYLPALLVAAGLGLVGVISLTIRGESV